MATGRMIPILTLTVLAAAFEPTIHRRGLGRLLDHPFERDHVRPRSRRLGHDRWDVGLDRQARWEPPTRSGSSHPKPNKLYAIRPSYSSTLVLAVAQGGDKIGTPSRPRNRSGETLARVVAPEERGRVVLSRSPAIRRIKGSIISAASRPLEPRSTSGPTLRGIRISDG